MSDNDHDCIDWNSGGACFICGRALSIEEQTRDELEGAELCRGGCLRSDMPLCALCAGCLNTLGDAS